MTKYLIPLLLMLTTMRAHATLDSTKILDQSVISILTATTNPASGGGIPATLGSLAIAEDTGVLYSKTGAPATSWSAFSSGGALTFSDSLVNTGGTVTLVNDSATPTASQYYGTNGSSVLGYFNLPSSSGANVTLSNLTSPTALNQSLIPNANNTFNIGTDAENFGTIFVENIVKGSPSDNNPLSISTDASSTQSTNQINILSGASSGAVFSTGEVEIRTGLVSSTTGGATGAIDFETGTSTSTSAGTGTVTIHTGNSSNATAGATGAVSISSGNLTSSGATANTGSLSFSTGNTPGTGISGSMNFTTGVTNTTASGALNINTGSPTGAGSGGDINISTGGSGSTGRSGDVNIGTSDVPGGESGAVTLFTGATSVTTSFISFQTNEGNDVNATLQLSGSLVSDSVAPNIPSIVIDGTTAAATAAHNVGIILSANNSQSALNFATADQASSSAASSIISITSGNDTLGSGTSGGTGSIVVGTGQSEGGTGASGSLQLSTGGTANAAANSGGVSIQTGPVITGATSGNISLTTGVGGTQGSISMSAIYVSLPQAAADPAGTPPGGSVYYNTTTGLIRYYNAVAAVWSNL